MDIPNKALVSSLLDQIFELIQAVKTDKDLNAFRVRFADILEQSSATFKDQRLIPQHLLDLAKLPSEVLHDLEDGCFGIRLSANEWHAVALDECHEMCINKDAKMAVVRLTPENMLYISHYLQFRADCINNLKLQLFPEQNEQKERFSFKPTAIDLTTDTNIAFMRADIEKDQIYAYQSSNQGLWNITKPHRIRKEICLVLEVLDKRPMRHV